MPTSLRRALACLAIAFALAAENIRAEPQNGWWWNPNESGRGFFIEVTEGQFFLAGYFYDDIGRATWLSSGGRVTDPYSYGGTLQSYRDGQSVFGTYHAPAPAVDVGPVSLTFSDDTHGTLTWPGGTLPIERLVFGEAATLEVFDLLNPLEPVFRPKTGWWWNSDESGSGYSVEIQGDQAFVVAFMYSEDGAPTWYFSAGPMSSPTHFEGDWLEFSGGQTLFGPYRPPSFRPLGRVTIDFAAFDKATITFSEGALTKTPSVAKTIQAGPPSRTSQAAPLLPQKIFTNSSDFPPFFDCQITLEINTASEAGSEGGRFTTKRITTYNALFSLEPNRVGRYTVDGSSSYDYEYDDKDTSNQCHTHGSKKGIYPLSGKLDISPYRQYYGKVFDHIGSTVTLHTDSCVQSEPPDVQDHISADLEFYGNVQTVNSALAAYNLNGWLLHAESDGSHFVKKHNCVSYPFRPR